MRPPAASPLALRQPDGSIPLLRRALDQDPGNRDLCLRLIRAMVCQGRFGQARDYAEGLLGRAAGDEEARFLLAWAVLGDGGEGVPDLLRGLASEKTACLALATTAADLGYWSTACALLARAWALDPADLACAQRYAIGLDYAGRFQEALALLADLEGRCLGDGERLAQVRFHQANSHLLLGNLEEGFRLMEARHDLEGSRKALPLPRWRGEPLQGRQILLRAEQGFGDVFMFVRYAALLAARGAEVYLEPFFSMQAVLATCPGVRGVLEGDVQVRSDMFQVDLLSLPYLCGTGPGSIPAAVPYLAVPDEVAGREALAEAIQGPGRRLGLVWSGNPGHRRSLERNLPAEILDLLEAVPGVTWFSLQKGEVARPGLPMVDLAPLLDDFSATAFALSRLDGLISVDTGIVHLAGALGVPTWVLLPHLPDWRWMLGRTDSPWYPSVTLWRQEAHWDWPGVLERVVGALSANPAPPASGGCLPPVP